MLPSFKMSSKGAWRATAAEKGIKRGSRARQPNYLSPFQTSSRRERLDAVVRWPFMPDRAMKLERLAEARRHVAEAERHLAHQREVIAQKERGGHDTATSKQLLDQFERTYTMYIAERDRLEKELVEAST